MFFKNFFTSLLVCIIFTTHAFNFEIPISGNFEREKEPKNIILAVDMAKVFNSHPMTQEYKKEIKDFAKSRKSIIEEMLKDLNSFDMQAQSINLKIAQMQNASSGSVRQSISELSKQLEDTNNLINEQKLKIADLSGRTKNEISLMEERNTASVLKNIDVLLKRILKKYDADVVLDKQTVLTGKIKDITDEVINMSKEK